LFNINRLRQHKVRADAECLGDSCLAFDYCNRKRRLIGSRIVCTLEEQGGILFAIAVHHDGVKVLCHQLLDRGEGLVARLDSEFQVGENLRDYARGFLVRTE
jgi:hypothetical protein